MRNILNIVNFYIINLTTLIIFEMYKNEWNIKKKCIKLFGERIVFKNTQELLAIQNIQLKSGTDLGLGIWVTQASKASQCHD